MPRHTDPPVRAKHTRAHVRAQWEISVGRRWRQAKDRHSGDWNLLAASGTVQDDPAVVAFCARTFQAVGPHLFIHPEEARTAPTSVVRPWPFARPRGDFARNPFNRCSCWLCLDVERQGRRSRERRGWRREVEAQLVDR